LDQALITNRRLDDLQARVESLKVAQELSVFQNDEDFIMDNPLNQDEKSPPPVEETKEPPVVPRDPLPKTIASKDEEVS